MKKIVLAAVLAVLAVALVPQAFAQGCTTQSCGSGLPPQSPAARSYDAFIQSTYLGAYGREATCFERVNEYNLLVNAANNGTLAAEARRFVATRFMTSGSYSVGDFTTYQQNPEYETQNPAANNDRASLEAFVGDLYRAFLQREPDTGGLCFWANDACTMLRKHTIRAFEVSIEFESLINGLYDGGRPSCTYGGGGGGGGEEPCPVSPGGFQPICPGQQ